MKQAPVNIKNKRATFDYELIDTYTAGIVLTGTEIKSIRMGKASLVDTFCYIANGELWVKNMHISEYFYGSYNNHSARRERKLLLTKKELDKLARGAKDPGFTMVPVRMFINEKGLAKVALRLQLSEVRQRPVHKRSGTRPPGRLLRGLRGSLRSGPAGPDPRGRRPRRPL